MKADLLRMLHNLVRLGSVEEVDHARSRARVRMGNLLTDWLPVMTARAGGDRTWWHLDAGEQVLVLSPGGDLAHGLVLGSLYQSDHPAPSDDPDLHRTEYKDGTVIEYHRADHRLRADVQGDIELSATGSIAIRANGHITINGQEVHVN